MRHSFALLATLALIGVPESFAADGPTKAEIADAIKNPALGPPIPFLAALSADNELATTESRGAGQAELSINRSDLTLSWKVTLKDLTSEVTGAHIHGPGRPGTKAEVIIDLAAGGLAGVRQGHVVLNEAQLGHFINDRVYLNVETAKYKEGEVRGQIVRILPAATQ